MAHLQLKAELAAALMAFDVTRLVGRKVDESGRPQDPKHAAEELARLAQRTDSIGARVWYLEWAKAFQRLAQIGDRAPEDRTPPRTGE